jgi:hypothetical protein
MERHETKNWGLIRDLLLVDGSATALGLAALIAGGALIGAGAVYAIRKIEDYFAQRERDLEDELGKVREARSQLDAGNDNDKSAAGAHAVYR